MLSLYSSPLSRGESYLYERKRLRADSEALGAPMLPSRRHSLWSTVVLSSLGGTWVEMT
jgi:hypothetical protein